MNYELYYAMVLFTPFFFQTCINYTEYYIKVYLLILLKLVHKKSELTFKLAAFLYI